MATSVFLIDDNKVVIDALTLLLTFDTDIDIVGTAKNCADAVSGIFKLAPDVIIIDDAQYASNCLEEVQSIRKIFPLVEIVVLSMRTADEFLDKLATFQAIPILKETVNLSFAVMIEGLCKHAKDISAENIGTVMPVETKAPATTPTLSDYFRPAFVSSGASALAYA